MSISPELALAAAAAIGDKALEDQTKELLKLKTQLAESRKVDITGIGGSPVYATGQFEDGKYRHTDGFSRIWWNVDVTFCEPIGGITLEILQHLEIRLGGIVYATTADDEVQRHRIITLDSDHFPGRNVIIPITSVGNCRNATIQIDLRDLPEPPWKMLRSVIAYNQTENNVDALIDVFDILTSSRQLPQRLPNQVVDLISISFDTSCVQSLLFALGR